MAGLADFFAESALNQAAAVNISGSRFIALFTTAPTSDAGSGGTEASGTGYARVQVAGNLAAASTGGPWSSTTITMAAAVPSWVVAGMNVYDVTGAANVGTVSSVAGSTVTLTAAASHAVANSDSLQFSAWPLASASSGTEPSVTPANLTNSNAVITFAQAGGTGWGTITSWGIYDASSGGNLYWWDYLGNYKWVPFSCTSASPGVITCDSASDAPVNGSSIVVTSKFGGTLPTTAGSWAGLLTTAGLSGTTFNAGVNTTSVGGGMFRQVASQPIAQNVTANFPVSSFTLSLA